MIAHKVQEPHGAKIEAAQRLQRQARQGGALQLACRQCMLSCAMLTVLGSSLWHDAGEAGRSIATPFLAAVLCLTSQASAVLALVLCLVR